MIRTLRLTSLLALAAILLVPVTASAAKRKPTRPSVAAVKAGMTDKWDTQFEHTTGGAGTITLKFEKVRLGKTRRARYDSRLIPWGTWITPVQATFVQTINYPVSSGPELSSPFVGPTTPATPHTDVTRVVQEALFYKTKFGWRFVDRGAKTTVLSRT